MLLPRGLTIGSLRLRPRRNRRLIRVRELLVGSDWVAPRSHRPRHIVVLPVFHVAANLVDGA